MILEYRYIQVLHWEAKQKPLPFTLRQQIDAKQVVLEYGHDFCLQRLVNRDLEKVDYGDYCFIRLGDVFEL